MRYWIGWEVFGAEREEFGLVEEVSRWIELWVIIEITYCPAT